MDEVYHVLTRGVDKRKIFMDDKNRFRFIHDLYEFNDEDWVGHRNNAYYFNKALSIDLRGPQLKRRNNSKVRKLLVDILSFCLMSNHYHLILRPLVQDGVSKFMRKLNMGYAKYFNIKHKRQGALFEGRYKNILIERDAHYLHLPVYIHLNPLDIEVPFWRERPCSSTEINKAFKILNFYRWSSHLDYLGQKNFPSVIADRSIFQFFKDEKEYKKALISWLRAPKIGRIKDYVLE